MKWRKRADDEADGKADKAGERAAASMSPLSGSPQPNFENKPGGVGADAEKGRVAERNDAGITENDVEREREQRGDGDLARQ